MRVLGELIVLLLVGGVALRYGIRRFVEPTLHRRRQEQLLKENARLDEELRQMQKGRQV